MQSSTAVVDPSEGVLVVVGVSVELGGSRGSSTGSTSSISKVASVMTSTVASPASISDWKVLVAPAAVSSTRVSMPGKANRRRLLALSRSRILCY